MNHRFSKSILTTTIVFYLSLLSPACSSIQSEQPLESYSLFNSENSLPSSHSFNNQPSSIYDENGNSSFICFEDSWNYDEDFHWRNNACNGNEINDLASHSFVKSITYSSLEEEGYEVYTCSVCGYSFKGEIVDEYRISMEEVIHLEYDSSLETSQDIDVFGDYLFVSFSGAENLKVYRLSSGELVSIIQTETFHGSSVQFSDEFCFPNDYFPLLYVGGCIDNRINVLRIIPSNDCWSAEIVRTIFIPTKYGYYASPSIDKENGILFIYSNGTMSASNNQFGILSKWSMSELFDNKDRTCTPLFISEKRVYISEVYQGHKFYNGFLFICYSAMSSPHESKIYSINTNTGEIVLKVDLTYYRDDETEGLCYRVVNGKIEWYLSYFFVVFRLIF